MADPRESPKATVDRIMQVAERFGDTEVSIVYRDNHWTVALVFGHEAEDSPMAGGAAYGMADDLGAAFDQALSECGV